MYGVRAQGRGFTLIELLVVIAIVAILAAILFPVFSNAKERSRQITCLANLKQLSAAFQSYCNDHSGIMPSGCARLSYGIEWTGSPNVNQPIDVSKGQLWNYVRTRGVYICPTDRNVKAQAIAGQPKDFELSYTLNECLASLYAQAPNTQRSRLVNLDVETAGRASKCLLLIHEARNAPGGGGVNDGFFSWRTTHNDLPSKVHYEGTTLSYADGHARWASYDQLLEESDADGAIAFSSLDAWAVSNPRSKWLSNYNFRWIASHGGIK